MSTYIGLLNWEMTRDERGHRDYTATHLVKGEIADGPSVIMETPGLSVIGDPWDFGNDFDPWAYCTAQLKVTPLIKREPNQYWEVQEFFTTRPMQRCQDSAVEDPLLEPDRISGSFLKYTQEAYLDRNDELIQTSAYEQIRGPAVEFDANRPVVQIVQNVADLELNVFSALIDHVNDSPLWGLPARCVKLSNVSWQRLVTGRCFYYYTRALDFDINFDTFDRIIPNEGTRVLSGHWDPVDRTWVLDDIDGGAPDPTNPFHYIRYKDILDENSRVILNEISGVPWGGALPVPTRTVEKYQESNLLVLDIPVTL